MPRWADDDEDWASEYDPDEDEYGEDEDDEEPTIPCPYCRREVHGDTQRCPYCASYISQEDAPPERKPWWIALGVVACLYVVYRWIIWF